jgi:amidase
VRLHEPPKGLEDFAPPLQPMIGCFGVAPARGQALSTATSAQNGGNMDYRRFAPGTTAWFPVAVPGALFYLGDGHACQGDGEIVGTGIETSFEMEFTFRVLKRTDHLAARRDGGRISSPSAMPARSIRRCSTPRPRCCAGSHEDYGLDARAASHLMGQVVRYDVGERDEAIQSRPIHGFACRRPRQRRPSTLADLAPSLFPARQVRAAAPPRSPPARSARH